MIRLPDIPGFSGTNLNQPSLNPAALAAPAVALGEAAQAIAGVSDQFHNAAIRVQKIENGRKVAEKRLMMQQEYANLQLELQKDPDPVSRMTRTRDFLAQMQGQMDGTDLPPAVRDQLAEHFDGFATQAVIRQGEDSANLAITRGKLAMQNEMEAGLLAGDIGLVGKSIDNALTSGLILPEEAEAMRRDAESKITLRTATIEIGKDASGWLEENSKDKPPAGVDPLQWQRVYEQAKEEQRGQTYEDTGTLQDAIVSGDITTTEELEKRASHLRPTVREKLKAILQDRASDDYKTRVSSPEYQNKTVGQIAGMIADYDPTAEGWDEKFVEMDGLIRSLPPGAVRDELSRNIEEVRTNKKREPKTHAEAGDQALDAARKEGLFGKLPSSDVMPTGRAINDGFLRDPAKLQSLGFSEEQAEEIIGSKKDTDKQRADRLKVGWVTRAKPDAEPAPIAAATARAILNGQDRIILDDPEMEDAIVSARIQEQLRFGKAKTDYAEWKKLNPNATNQEVEEKIRTLAGEDQRQKLSSGIYTPKPARSSGPLGADDSTSAVPIGDNLTQIVKNFEASSGFHREAYWDYGQWSIGYGTRSKKGEVIDQAEADRRLTAELASHRSRVVTAAAKTGHKFTPAQIDALTSFDYNTGKIETLLAEGTRSKSEIAEKMLLYRNAGGERLRGLERRRKAERELFLRGYTGKTETAQNTGELSEFNVIQ